MSVDYIGVTPELALSVDRSTPGGVGRQVQEALRDAVRSGRLRAGERLPSTRQLADQLRVSRGLVVSAYEQLVAEGYVVSAVGSGTRVAATFAAASVGREVSATQTSSAPTIDFGYGVPDLRAFPTRDWLWAMTDAIRTMPTAALGDGDAAGHRQLREVLASYHRRVRSGCADAAHTIVVGGFRQGLNVVLGALVAGGVRQIGLEDPGPRDHDRIAARAGLRVSAIPVDADGIDVECLRSSGARAVLLTPAHQCPTGAVLSAARRRELVQWAHDVDGVILEDDYDAEFRYDRQPVGSLQGLAPEHVVALGSVSKTLAPAVRIGWLFAPSRFVEEILTEKSLSCRGVPELDQLALARLIESGRLDRHLRKMRDSYRRRRDVLVAAVADYLPGASVTGLDAGQHVVVQLPSDADEDRVVAGANDAGVAVRGLGHYRAAHADEAVRRAVPSGLVIGFGNVTPREIRAGIRILGTLLAG